jgi:hypothetical protein
MQEYMLPLDTSPRRIPFFFQCLAVLAIMLLQSTARREANSSDDALSRHEYLQAWLTLPPNVPANINNEDELGTINRFLSAIHSGGIGNILFQMAAGYSIAKEINSTCIIGWWDQLSPQLQRRNSPFDGRPPPAPGITLKHIFPNILYLDFFPETRNLLFKNALHNSSIPLFHGDRCSFNPFPKSLQGKNQIWLSGLFNHYRSLFVAHYAHRFTNFRLSLASPRAS